MDEWTWDDEFGRFSVRLQSGALTLSVEATARGSHEMGWSTGCFPRTLESLHGDVPIDILAQITRAFARGG